MFSTARLLMVCGWVSIQATAIQLDRGALVPLYRQALEEREKQLGRNHPKTARSASDLGLYLRNIGDRSGAAPYLERAFEIDAKTLRPSSKLLAEDLENL